MSMPPGAETAGFNSLYLSLSLATMAVKRFQ